VADYPNESLSVSDLLELSKGGAKIKIDRPPQRIAQFDELVELTKQLIATNKARIEADEARNKSQLEVLATLQSLIRSGNVTKSHPVDLAPLKTVLSEIQENTQAVERPSYVLSFDRTKQGFIDGREITIRPVYNTKH